MKDTYTVIIDNSADKKAKFKLIQPYLTNDIFEYVLQRSGSNINFVKSGNYANHIRSLAFSAKGTVMAIGAMSNSLSKRVGELRFQNDNFIGPFNDSSNGVWVRGFGRISKASSDIDKMKQDIIGTEFGFDRLISEEKGIYLGVIGQIAHGNECISPKAGYNTDIYDQAFSGGIYSIWLAKNGWYCDVIGRYFAINKDFKIDYNTYDFKQNAIGAEIESGKEIVLNNIFYITPRGQINFINIGSAKSDTDLGEAEIKNTVSYIFNIGLMAGVKTSVLNSELKPYMKLNYYRYSGEPVKTQFSGVIQKAEVSGNRIEIGLGATAKLMKSVNTYFDFAYQVGDEYSDVNGNIGLRYSF